MDIHTEFEAVWERVEDGDEIKTRIEDSTDQVYVTVTADKQEPVSVSWKTVVLIKFHDLFGWDFPVPKHSDPRPVHITIGDGTAPVTENPRTVVKDVVATVLSVTGCEYTPTYDDGEMNLTIDVNDMESESGDNPHENIDSDADISSCPYFNDNVTTEQVE